MAMLGGLTRAIVHSKTARDLTKWDRIKSILLAPIAGIVYFHMYVEWNVPDHVIAFFFAYSFVDLIDRLAKIILSTIHKH